MKPDYLIVGAGFAGSTCARLLAERGKKVLIVEKRLHAGGNAYDYFLDGIQIHKYGAHIFHTNSEKVVKFLSQFTEWRKYEHKVKAVVGGKCVPMPVNVNTINALFNVNVDEEGAKHLIEQLRESKRPIYNAEDQVIATMGAHLYYNLFYGYTRKQWGREPKDLMPSVTARIPLRFNRDDRYFTDTWQIMPLNGYAALFDKMLDHKNITKIFGLDWLAAKSIEADRVIFTGPIDEYYEHRLGKLPYRSLRFQHQMVLVEQALPAAVVNYPNGEEFTRIIEHKQLTGQKARHTVLSFEYPTDIGEPYYPVPCNQASALYQQYKALADAEKDVFFCGRLGTYKYYNMDQVVAQAMTLVEKLSGNKSASFAFGANE